MPRPKKDSELISTRINRVKRDYLAQAVIDLGYSYRRTDPVTGTETIQPLWGEWLEAIADKELIMYKKISLPLDDQR